MNKENDSIIEPVNTPDEVELEFTNSETGKKIKKIETALIVGTTKIAKSLLRTLSTMQINLKLLSEKCLRFAEEDIAPKPFLNGQEVMALTGLKQSKELGDIIKNVYQAQLDGTVTDKASAEEYVKKLI